MRIPFSIGTQKLQSIQSPQACGDDVTVKLKNTPGEPIVTRDGARFYCVACYKAYQKCKCRVYMSADTLLPHGSKNREKRECTAFALVYGHT